MEPLLRRQRYASFIRTTLSHENRLLRHITFTYVPMGQEGGNGRTQTAIDGQEVGVLSLGVRSAVFTSDQERKLKSRGFTAEIDGDDPRYTVYTTDVPGATVDDLVTFVEWVHLTVLDAPDTYEVTIQTISSQAQAKGERSTRGCFKSCKSVAMIGFWVILGLILLGILFRR